MFDVLKEEKKYRKETHEKKKWKKRKVKRKKNTKQRMCMCGKNRSIDENEGKMGQKDYICP